jgi:hypothetical protein
MTEEAGLPMINMTICQLQWDRLTDMAKMQQAPPEFWAAHKAIRPRGGQIEQPELDKLRKLMLEFKLKSED